MTSDYLEGLRIYEEGRGELFVWFVVLYLVVMLMEKTNAWKHVSGYGYWTEMVV